MIVTVCAVVGVVAGWLLTSRASRAPVSTPGVPLCGLKATAPGEGQQRTLEDLRVLMSVRSLGSWFNPVSGAPRNDT